ncbi:MAG: uracil phosphoribosyltransferase [Gammaproteobacteria bacterium]|nr:uracil phosphoribosyltransferase [Gammaproteobacteria bacterium]
MLHVLKHPLLDSKMAILRDKSTSTKNFKDIVDEIGMLVTYEITRDLKTKVVEVETPFEKMECHVLATDIVIVPILRAGLGMVDGIRRIIPNASIGHIGMYRDEKTLVPIEYYFKLPTINDDTTCILVDPMLATGNSCIKGIELLKSKGVKHIIYVGLVACPEGIKAVQDKYPDVELYTVAVDRELNDIGYILPGLGDCGDRLFGTK